MDEKKMVDIFNQGQRSYGLRNGVRLEPKSGATVEQEEAETLFKAYPQDIVSPDSYRTSGGDYRDQAAEMQRLREEVAALKSSVPVSVSGLEAGELLVQGQKTIDDLNKQIDALKSEGIEATAKALDLQTKLDQATADGTTEMEQVMALSDQVKDLQTKLDDATKIIATDSEQIQALTVQLQTEKDGSQSFADAVQAMITEYNAALDVLPAGAVPPHFALATASPPST